MQQETIRKKKEIIDLFLKNGVLLSSEFLQSIENEGQADRIFEILKVKISNGEAVAEIDLEKLPDGSFQEEKELGKKEPLSKVK
ncbi:MAG TPA: hypothetical protein VJB06_02315, partial [archaeon]|nr:hypothetical protein [archaeon]